MHMDPILTLIFSLEMLGVVAFALSGVMVAIANDLDILGAVVLGAITAVGGGVIRDVLLGELPPAMFQNPVYALTAIGVSLAAFVIALCMRERFVSRMERLGWLINLLDSVGLGIFVTVGVDAAIRAGFGDNVFLTLFVATMTGVGGGIMRDQLVGRVPMVLRKHIYVMAAIGGAVLYYALLVWWHILQPVAQGLAALFVVLIRNLAAHYRWNMPRLHRDAQKK